MLEIIARSGAFYTFHEQKVQGKDNLAKLLQEDSALRTTLEHEVTMAIKEMRMGKKAVPTTIDESDGESMDDAGSDE